MACVRYSFTLSYCNSNNFSLHFIRLARLDGYCFLFSLFLCHFVTFNEIYTRLSWFLNVSQTLSLHTVCVCVCFILWFFSVCVTLISQCKQISCNFQYSHLIHPIPMWGCFCCAHAIFFWCDDRNGKLTVFEMRRMTPGNSVWSCWLEIDKISQRKRISIGHSRAIIF